MMKPLNYGTHQSTHIDTQYRINLTVNVYIIRVFYLKISSNMSDSSPVNNGSTMGWCTLPRHSLSAHKWGGRGQLSQKCSPQHFCSNSGYPFYYYSFEVKHPCYIIVLNQKNTDKCLTIDVAIHNDHNILMKTTLRCQGINRVPTNRIPENVEKESWSSTNS